IFRLLKLFDSEKINYKASDEIISIGKPAKELEINLSHELIERLLGSKIKSEFVEKIFGKLGFEFSKNLIKKENSEFIEYEVKVPTCRSTKDVQIKEDLVEEIGRFFGYENTDFVLPKKLTTPYDLSSVLRARNIKKLLSYGLKMREVRNYAFYDESFLAKLNWEPKEYKEVTNPVSENWRRLATSLVPHLVKNIDQNFIHHDKLSFFEMARVWNVNNKVENGVKENKSLAGIFFDKNGLDFYTAKSWIIQLFDLIGFDDTGINNSHVKWEKVDSDFVQENYPWYFACQTAKITFGDNLIGYAGMLDNGFFGNLFEGSLFAFEFDGEFLVNYKPVDKKLTQISKYPEVSRDLSMFVSLSITVDQLINTIISCSEKIKSACLLDFFQKDEWKDKKSLTFRFIVQDNNKTLDKEEVDVIYDTVVKALAAIGAELR
ncbi:MAG: phenylalanyl-tRNA synthetase beta chain, partial [uncultured bacterium]